VIAKTAWENAAVRSPTIEKSGTGESRQKNAPKQFTRHGKWRLEGGEKLDEQRKERCGKREVPPYPKERNPSVEPAW